MTAEAHGAPIIIKRKKVSGGDGHHGGAWKVAYADFVTAMMAFFMLMWLLNATTETQRSGLADYFSPTIAISKSSGGAEGMFGGDSVRSEDTLHQMGVGASATYASDAQAARGATGHAEEASGEDVALEEIETALRARAGESLDDGVMRHVTLEITDEGLSVEIFALPGRPLFERGSDGAERPSETLAAIAQVLAGGFSMVRNDVAVAGHVAASPLVLRTDPAWRASQDRADSVRRMLERGGLEPARSARVTGHADREPAVADAMDVRNDRIEVVLLR